MSHPLMALLERELHPRILVLGDVMLDRYVWGDVARISPEGPIPILRVDKREERLGGAGSVASMLAALEARATLASVVGEDAEGRIVRDLLERSGVDSRLVVTVSDRPTTVKERLLGRSHQHNPHHMMRVDRENDGAIAGELADRLLSEIAACLAEFDLVVVSDYNKGVCAGHTIPALVERAKAANRPVLVDPVRGRDFRCYQGCACITPNRVEAGWATGMKIISPQDGLDAARKLLAFGVDAAVVTLDRDGIAWAARSGEAGVFPCRPREVSDVTGAGDMVLSAIGYCLAAGADYPTAIEMANLAGGMEVERLGVSPITRRELLAEVSGGTLGGPKKVLGPEQVKAELDRERRAGKRIVMTNGCFDLLHPGHVKLLEGARRQGDCLLVGLNSDRSVRELKGPGRPMVDQEGRARMLSALSCVDYVVLFDETSVAGLVGEVRPDVLVKGGDYTPDQVVGHELVQAYGGRVVLVPADPRYSTTGLVQRITEGCGRES